MSKPATSADAPKKTATPKKRAPARRKGAAVPVPLRLGEAEIAAAQSSARHWTRQDRYAVNEYVVHPKFGVGLVTGFTEQGYIVCLFADGDTRKLIHATPA
ncbi:MAG: hypothetical protein U0414_19785 [Polyangiaceae bacterium]